MRSYLECELESQAKTCVLNTTIWIVQTCQMKEIVQVRIYYWPKELNVDIQGLNNIFYERNGCVVLNRSAFLCSIHEWVNIFGFLVYCQ